MTNLPKPKAIWAEQAPLEGESSPYGCLDCPQGVVHTQIYLLNGNSLCYTHAHIRKGQEIDHEFGN